MVLEVEPKGVDNHSILPRHIIEGVVECVDYAIGVGNPLHHHKMTGEIHIQNLLEVLH